MGDLEELEVLEDLPVEVERRRGDATLEGQEGAQSLGHAPDPNQRSGLRSVREGRRLRPLRAAGGAAGRRRSDAVTRRRAGARRVAATSVNLSDWETLAGLAAVRPDRGLRSPARRTLGSDIAGRVEAVGPGVTRFRLGDEVYGDNLALKGGFAEYAVAPESALAHKPDGADLRRGVDDPPGGSDRAAGHRRRRGRAAGC